MAGYRASYTLDDDKKILDLILDREAFYVLHGNTFWKYVEHKKIVDRSWQSIKEHFRKHIMRKLYMPHYELNQKQIKQIELGWMQTSKNDVSVRRANEARKKVPETKKREWYDMGTDSSDENVSETNEAPCNDNSPSDDDTTCDSTCTQVLKVGSSNTTERNISCSPIDESSSSIEFFSGTSAKVIEVHDSSDEYNDPSDSNTSIEFTIDTPESPCKLPQKSPEETTSQKLDSSLTDEDVTDFSKSGSRLFDPDSPE